MDDAADGGSRDAVFPCDLAQALAEPLTGQGYLRLAAERHFEKYGRENAEKTRNEHYPRGASEVIEHFPGYHWGFLTSFFS